jgi:hypothetical protein
MLITKGIGGFNMRCKCREKILGYYSKAFKLYSDILKQKYTSENLSNMNDKMSAILNEYIQIITEKYSSEEYDIAIAKAKIALKEMENYLVHMSKNMTPSPA